MFKKRIHFCGRKLSWVYIFATFPTRVSVPKRLSIETIKQLYHGHLTLTCVFVISCRFV